VLFVCLVLEIGVLSGVPVQAREVEELMKQLSQPKLAHVLPSAEEEGDDDPLRVSPNGQSQGARR